ncbi:MAG: metallophosphoesterase [Promethearchaeota archaeon]
MIDSNVLKNLITRPKMLSEVDLGTISIILQTVKTIFEKENLLLEFNLVDVNEKVYVIGDIHGDLNTLLKLFEKINEKNPEFVIFLGDIVDRGPKQLECLLFVFVLKILEPKRYFLLKGNHETLEMNQYYGFVQDFMSRFQNLDKFKEILDVYNVLPLCALINHTILCLHGGIPQDFEILDKLRNIKTKNLNLIFESVSQAIIQIMWNDPKTDLEGFSDSFRGPGIKFFGEDVFETFLNKNNLSFILRAHECFPEGYRWFFHKRLLSIFSSANYRGYNPASFAMISGVEVDPKNLK